MNLFSKEKENNDNLFLLKNRIIEYNNSLQQNLEFNNKIFFCYFNREEFFTNHNYIETIQKQIEEKNKKIFLMKESLLQMKQRYNKIEQERKKLLSYNNSLEKETKNY